MKNKRLEYILFGILIGAALTMIATCIVLTIVPVKHYDDSQKYDLECEKQYVKYPLEDCKIKEQK